MSKTLSEQLRETGKQFYAIAFSMRSGSTLLCEDLSVGGLGKPTEYFQPRFYVADVLAGSRTAVGDYILRLVEQTPGPMFGFKISWEQVFSLTTYLGREGVSVMGPDLEAVFPDLKWVRIWRKNKVQQAISAWRAVNSEIWHQTDERVPESRAKDPGYDFEDLKPYFFQVQSEDWLWEQHFKGTAVSPFDICYEEYILDRLKIIRGIAEYLGATVSTVSAANDTLRMMRSGWTTEIEQRFLADLYRPRHPIWVHDTPPTNIPGSFPDRVESRAA